MLAGHFRASSGLQDQESEAYDSWKLPAGPLPGLTDPRNEDHPASSRVSNLPLPIGRFFVGEATGHQQAKSHSGYPLQACHDIELIVMQAKTKVSRIC